MKSSSLISLFVSASAAHDTISKPASVAVCRTSSLRTALLDSPVCLSNNLSTKYDEPPQAAENQFQWPISQPCVRNGTTEFCAFSDPEFANGRGIIFITTPERAAYLAKHSIFSDPEPLKDLQALNAPRSAKFKTEHVPGKDIGVIATHAYQVGDHIMSNTASMMVDYAAYYALSPEAIAKLEGRAVQYFPPNHRSIFMNLSTHDHTSVYEEIVEKIISTNSFDIEDLDRKNDQPFYTVFPEISRMNHDCRPNADYYFDADTMTHHIHAVRPIMPGEEITISYIDPLNSREYRMNRLNYNWHFQCSCSLCTGNSHMTDESDERVQQINELRKELQNYEPKSRATPQMGELMVSLYEQERLWLLVHEAYTFAAIEWNGVGEPWMATKYARLAIQHGLASSGPEDTDVVEMTALAENPWDHWSWMLRTKKRNSWGQKTLDIVE